MNKTESAVILFIRPTWALYYGLHELTFYLLTYTPWCDVNIYVIVPILYYR